jgi:hypothetical protein
LPYETTERELEIKRKLEEGWKYEEVEGKVLLVPPKRRESKREKTIRVSNPTPQISTKKIEDRLDNMDIRLERIEHDIKTIFDLTKISKIYKTPEKVRKAQRELMRRRRKTPKSRWKIKD